MLPFRAQHSPETEGGFACDLASVALDDGA